jgi:hypothetical protein
VPWPFLCLRKRGSGFPLIVQHHSPCLAHLSSFLLIFKEAARANLLKSSALSLSHPSGLSSRSHHLRLSVPSRAIIKVSPQLLPTAGGLRCTLGWHVKYLGDFCRESWHE